MGFLQQNPVNEGQYSCPLPSKKGLGAGTLWQCDDEACNCETIWELQFDSSGLLSAWHPANQALLSELEV